MCHLAHHIAATDETAYGRFHVSRRKTVGSQHKRVVGNLYVFAHTTCYFHTPHIIQTLQRRFNLPLDVFLQLLIAQVGIHLIGQQQPCRFLAALLIHHLAAREVGIAHALWQPFTHLPQQRCYLKLHGRDISVFLQFCRHLPPPEIALRAHTLHTLHRCHQSLNTRGDVLLYHLGRRAPPPE